MFGLSPAMAALLGMLTGIGGGMMRDLLLTEIPQVLRSDLYAVAALAAASTVVVGDPLNVPYSIVQIESASGIAALDEILKVNGVDAVFVGPSDPAADMGHLGQPGHPEVRAAVESAVVKIAAAGKAAGVFSADTTQAKRYLEMGASFLLVGVDALLLRNASAQLVWQFKSAPEIKPGASY